MASAVSSACVDNIGGTTSQVSPMLQHHFIPRRKLYSNRLTNNANWLSKSCNAISPMLRCCDFSLTKAARYIYRLCNAGSSCRRREYLCLGFENFLKPEQSCDIIWKEVLAVVFDLPSVLARSSLRHSKRPCSRGLAEKNTAAHMPHQAHRMTSIEEFDWV